MCFDCGVENDLVDVSSWLEGRTVEARSYSESSSVEGATCDECGLGETGGESLIDDMSGEPEDVAVSMSKSVLDTLSGEDIIQSLPSPGVRHQGFDLLRPLASSR
jgi:hypothetical protein